MLTISSVTSSAWNGAGLLVLAGNLDSLDAIKLGRAVDALHEQGVVDIMLDVADVSYVNSQGWGMFVGRLHRAGGNARFRFFAMRPTVLETLQLIGIDRVDGIRLYPNFDAALQASRAEASHAS